MTALTLALAVLAAPADKPAPPAQVVITADLACLHCTFGEGERCAVCLKVDDKTPVLLAGKLAARFEEMRLDRKVVSVEGVLTLDKEKRLVLTGEQGRLVTDADKGKVPDKGQARVAGAALCGSCDLNLCDRCTLAVGNGAFPIILDGKLAADHAEAVKQLTVVGRLYVDKRGLVRLDASKVEKK
jgi:hypothetical protein